MDIRKSLQDYMDATKDSEDIVNRHMAAAMAEIKEKYGLAPTYIEVITSQERQMSQQFASGVLVGSKVTFDR